MISIRTANDSDLPRLVAWAQAMAWETERKTLCADRLTAGISRGLADSDKAQYFIAEQGRAMAGTLMLTREWSDWRNGWWWWIQSVYVDRAHRNRGIYRALHQHVAKLAAQHGDVCGLRLYVENNNTAAQKTYHALGMHDANYRVYEQTTRIEPAADPHSTSTH